MRIDDRVVAEEFERLLGVDSRRECEEGVMQMRLLIKGVRLP